MARSELKSMRDQCADKYDDDERNCFRICERSYWDIIGKKVAFQIDPIIKACAQAHQKVQAAMDKTPYYVADFNDINRIRRLRCTENMRLRYQTDDFSVLLYGSNLYEDFDRIVSKAYSHCGRRSIRPRKVSVDVIVKDTVITLNHTHGPNLRGINRYWPKLDNIKTADHDNLKTGYVSEQMPGRLRQLKTSAARLKYLISRKLNQTAEMELNDEALTAMATYKFLPKYSQYLPAGRFSDFQEDSPKQPVKTQFVFNNSLLKHVFEGKADDEYFGRSDPDGYKWNFELKNVVMAFAGAAGKVWGKNQINSVRKRSLGEQRYWVDKKLEPYTYSSVLSSPLSIVLSTVDGRDTFALPKLQLELVKFLSLNPSSSVVARQFFENLIAYLRHKDTIQQSFNDWQQKKAIHLRHAELGLFDPSFYVYLENAEPWHSESYWPGRIFSGSVSGRLLKASPKSKHFDSDEIETLAYQRFVNRLKTLNIDDKSYNQAVFNGEFAVSNIDFKLARGGMVSGYPPQIAPYVRQYLQHYVIHYGFTRIERSELSAAIKIGKYEYAKSLWLDKFGPLMSLPNISLNINDKTYDKLSPEDFAFKRLMDEFSDESFEETFGITKIHGQSYQQVLSRLNGN